MRSLARSVVLGAGASAVCACSFLLDEGYAQPPPAAATEAGTTSDAAGQPRDAGQGADTSSTPADAGSDSGAPLLRNASFEEQGANCGPEWRSDDGALGFVSGRTGQGCKVCSTSMIDGWFGTSQEIELPPGTYRIEGWLRPGPSAIDGCEVGVDVLVAGGEPRQIFTTNCAPAVSDWQHLSITRSLVAGETAVRFFASGHATTSGRCFEVDDVAITRLP